MIGAKPSDQWNLRNAGRFKSTNQRLAYRGNPPRFSRRSNPSEEAKRQGRRKIPDMSQLRFHLTLLRYSDEDGI